MKNLTQYQYNNVWINILAGLILGWGSIFYTPAYAELSVAKEYQIKAVFLYNFANFVTWPKEAFINDDGYFHICILGEDPFKSHIDVTVKGEKIKGRAVTVERLSYINQSDHCQILFISESEKVKRSSILNYLKGRPILTVSDIKNFAEKGGMIQFYSYKNRIRFFIAPKTVKSATLVASANLLKIAKIVD